jgi:hypothetical protein
LDQSHGKGGPIRRINADNYTEIRIFRVQEKRMGERGRQSGVDGGGLAVFAVRVSSYNLPLSRHNLTVLQLFRLSLQSTAFPL